MLATDADLLVLLIKSRTQASSTIALCPGGTKSILLTLLQGMVLWVVQQSTDLERNASRLQAWEGGGTECAGEDERGFHFMNVK